MRFHETQRFRQRWLWVVIIVVLLPIVVLVGTHAASNAELMVVFVIVFVVDVGVIAVFVLARLDVTVTEREVLIRFRPFHISGRRIALSEIAEARARKYRPIAEYGGWGIRYGFGGVAYNVAGNEGVQLVLTNGKRILIGSQRSRELEAALKWGQTPFQLNEL